MDRSPSVGASQQNERLIDILAEHILTDIVALTRQKNLPLFFASVNFGRNTSDPHPLKPIPLDASPTLPRYEVIPYTDFRVALNYAMEQIHRGETLYGKHQILVILFTDSEPWPPGGKLSEQEKKSYFQGTGRFSTEPALLERIRAIHGRDGQLIVMAANDNANNANLWRSYVGSEHYISSRESSNPIADVHRLLTQANQEAPQEPIPPATVVEPQEHTTKWAIWPIGFLVIPTFGLLLVLMIRQRALIGRQNDVIKKQQLSIENLETIRGEELGAVQDLETRAGVVAKQDKEQAIRIYKAALDKRVELLRKKDIAGKSGVSDTVSKMLKLCEGDLEKERRLITELLREGPRREVANGLAPVLAQRWSANKAVFLQEFELLRMEPLGIYILDGLVKLADQENEKTNAFTTALAQFAQAARELHRHE